MKVAPAIDFQTLNSYRHVDDLSSLCITKRKDRMRMRVLCVCVWCIHDHVCVHVSWLNACRRELILFLQGTITIENPIQESIIGK